MKRQKRIAAGAESGMNTQSFPWRALNSKQHFTQPPAHYTEASSGQDAGGAGHRPSEYVCTDDHNDPLPDDIL